MDPRISRRCFLKVSFTGAGVLMVPAWAVTALGDPDPTRPENAHFFLHIVLQGGLDNTYLFDARPLEMTAKGLIANYVGEGPILMEGINGTKAWRTKMTEPLMAFRDRFSVVNGLFMTANFDGHDQNSNLLFTGSPFGGDSFLPLLNQAAPPTTLPAAAIDGVLSGRLNAALLNHGNIIPLDSDSARKLSRGVRSLGADFGKDAVADFIRARLQANAQGSGAFSSVVRAMGAGFGKLPSLAENVGQIQVGTPSGNQPAELAFLSVVTEMFRRQAARTAVYAPIGLNLDTHAPGDAKGMPAVASEVSRLVASVFKYLSETSFDSQRSLFDVTTVLVTSEFGRTMRQKNLAIDQTGTDHNPYSNSAIIAGKGIRGGAIVGGSDFRTSDEELSKAHLALDRDRLKLTGRPFDFKSMAPRPDLPETFVPEDYLNPASVVNTVYSLFGLPEKLYRAPFRNKPPSPVLTPLLNG